ncbi:ParM/StbA family protein [Solimonas sp. SE-A11]|uniref:ParM/StbA family protein n=1 Tax=Solimonas sp. SE-A11 TaxID=3054954 RepID=UPI00259CDCBB|nr:ParM/StbA family protein [Solimonas sp. SE-A11]
MKVLGADIGFGYTKATDGKQHQIFKSIVGEANESQFGESLLPGQPLFPRHLIVGGQSVFVGELAETQSRGRGFTLDQTQFLTQYKKTLALAALAPFVDSGDPIRLVAGLPISYFRKHKDALTTLLQNRHPVTVVKPGSGEREEKVLYVERVRVIPQPFGSMFNLMLNDVGKAASQRFVSEKIGIIDIGFRTADYTISDKTRYSERGSQSSDSGISVAYTAIANALLEKSGINVELYRLYEGISKGSIKIKGKRYDLNAISQAAFGQLASRIAQEVNRLWADDWDIDAIVITGGGGASLAPFLTPLLEGEVLPVPADQDARLNNVMGYWKYGMNIWGA